MVTPGTSSRKARLTGPDGKTLHGVFFYAQDKQTGTVIMHKQSEYEAELR
jgi:hypothetical protein